MAVATATGGGLAAVITCPATRSKKVSSAVVVVASSSSKPIREGFPPLLNLPKCSATLSSRSSSPPNPPLASSSRLDTATPGCREEVDDECGLVVVGLNMATAPSAMREKLVFPEDEYPRVIQQIRGLPSVKEAVVISSPLQFEVYAVAQPGSVGVQQLLNWMSKKSLFPSSELNQHVFFHRDGNAARHLFQASVSCDLSSEQKSLTYKLCQISKFYSGREYGKFGVILSDLFAQAILLEMGINPSLPASSLNLDALPVDVPQQLPSFSAAKSKSIQFPPTPRMFTTGEDGKCSLLVVGLNIETVPSAMHVKLAFSSEEYPCVIKQLSGLSSIKEVGVLCSSVRFEVYVVAQSWSLGIQQVTEWMSKRIDDSYELYQHIFVLRDDNAVRHLYEGMSSYDVLNTHLAFKVLTLQQGQEVPGFGVILCELFIRVFRFDKIFGVFPAKAPIGSSAVTVAFSELHESSRQHPPSFLVIGADRTCKLVIKKLLFSNYKKIVVLSDAVEQIGNFQEEFAGIGIIYRPMSQLLSSISEANVVFIGLLVPLFSKRDVDDLPAADEEMGGTRIFIDLCNPFNFCLSGVGFASGHNIDDLFKFRQDKASHIHKGSMRKAKRFMSWMETVLEDDAAYGDRAKNSQGHYARWL